MDLAASYRRSVEAWVAAVDGVGDRWCEPTPCNDWDVRALVNHVVGEDRWTKPLVDGMTIAEVGDSLDGDLLGDEPRRTAALAAAEALSAVDERLPEAGLVHLSYGDEKIAEYIWQLTADHLVHGWDLRAATGQDRTLEPEVVAAVARWFTEREAAYRSAGIIAGRPDSASISSPQDELVVAFGRDPAWSA